MVTVSIEPKSFADFMAAIQKYASRSKQTLRDATLEQAALACRDAAMFTPPLAKGGGKGLSAAAEKAGKQAVDRDVGKVVAPLTGGTRKTQQARFIKRLGSLALNDNASLFWKVAAKGSSVLNGNPFLARVLSDRYNGFGTVWGFKKLRNYFNKIGTKVSGELNQAYLQDVSQINNVYRPIYRKTGGRLWKNGRNVSGLTSMNKFIVENKEDIALFVAKRQESVGAIKSGWAMALKALPKPMINGVAKDFGVDLLNAAWITKHNSVAGVTRCQIGDNYVEVLIRNTNGNINGIADQANVLGLVYGNRVKQMPGRIRRLLQKDIDNFNKK
ncbi:MAG: hypothetical protein ACO3HF_08420 [Burkholderiaceae bacterium]